MSELTERHMRGQISKSEYLAMDDEQLKQIDRCERVYPMAMAAYEKHFRDMERCTCEWDYAEDTGVSHQRNPTCPVHTEEEE